MRSQSHLGSTNSTHPSGVANASRLSAAQMIDLMQIEVLQARVTKCEEELEKARDELEETEGIQNCLMYS